jgi:hypothetical protein
MIRKTIFALLLFAGSATAIAAAMETVDAKGQPAFQPGKDVGLYVWTDAKGTHLRWSSNGKPMLFSGTIEVDGTAGNIERLNAFAGGWVDKPKENTVMFSVTATAGADGADFPVTGGTWTRVIDIQIDGNAPDLNLIFAGEKLAHPKALPFRFKSR